MMTVTFTCDSCQSAIEVYPSSQAEKIKCDICQHEMDVVFNQKHVDGRVEDCPKCLRKDFYIQKDFNRKIGVLLFIVAAILSIYTYGISLIVLWLLDFFLFKKINNVVVCYKCNTLFRNGENWKEIRDFNHEMHDRIVYTDHNFEGKPLNH